MPTYTGLEAWKNFDIDDDYMEWHVIRCGAFRIVEITDEDGGKRRDYEFLREGRKLTIEPDELFGMEVVLCCNSVNEVKVEQRFEVRSGDTPAVVYQGQRDGAVEEGEYVFRVRFPENQYADEVKKKIKVKVG